MNIRAQPLLSVIIPTHNRPQYLPRAVKSALDAAPNGEVEVIVVPNGPDTSWQEVSKQYQNEPHIIWSAIETAHANAARNHGLELAKGKYIRFLDDDDYFYPGNAKEQLIELIDSQAELSYSCLDHIDANGILIKNTEPEDKEDYVTAVVGTGNPTATLTLIYSQSLLKNTKWGISVNKNQDVYWAYSICAKREFKSVYYPKPAGAWVQHDGERVSEGHTLWHIAQENAEQLLKLANSLKQQKRLNNQRAAAISIALWQRVHEGTMRSPCYWRKVAKQASLIMPKQYPRTAMYNSALVRRFNPFFVELVISPYRWLRILLGHTYKV